MKEILIFAASFALIIAISAIMSPDKTSKCEALQNDRSMFVPARCFDNFNPSK